MKTLGTLLVSATR